MSWGLQKGRPKESPVRSPAEPNEPIAAGLGRSERRSTSGTPARSRGAEHLEDPVDRGAISRFLDGDAPADPGLALAQGMLASPRTFRPHSSALNPDIRYELEMLEEKLSRQVVKVQEQSERFLDVLMHPLESKVAAMEGKGTSIDCQLSELKGGVKGLQEAMEIQVRRTEAAEARLRKWRSLLEDDIKLMHTELKEKVVEVASLRLPETVTRDELLGVADMLKQELKRLVNEAMRAGGAAATRQELATVMCALRDEVKAVEESSAAAWGDRATAQQDLAAAAESLRSELASLAAKVAFREEAPLPDEEKDPQSFPALADRTSRNEVALQELKGEIRHLEGEVARMQASALHDRASVQQELTSAAESARRELLLLSQASQAHASGGGALEPSSAAVWELQQASELLRRSLVDLTERVTRAELNVQDALSELQRLEGDISKVKVESMTDRASAQQELTRTADSVRREILTIAEKAAQDDVFAIARAPALLEIQQALQACGSQGDRLSDLERELRRGQEVSKAHGVQLDALQQQLRLRIQGPEAESSSLKAEVNDIWAMLAEVAEAAGVKSAQPGLHSHASQGPPLLDEPGTPCAAAAGVSEAAAAAASAAAAAVRNAAAAVMECQEQLAECRQTTDMVSEDVAELREEWRSLTDRVSCCEQEIGLVRRELVCTFTSDPLAPCRPTSREASEARSFPSSPVGPDAELSQGSAQRARRPPELYNLSPSSAPMVYEGSEPVQTGLR